MQDWLAIFKALLMSEIAILSLRDLREEFYRSTISYTTQHPCRSLFSVFVLFLSCMFGSSSFELRT